MKISRLLPLALLLFCEIPLASQGAEAEPKDAVTFAPTEPVISTIRGRIVRVRVPAGFERVTLQVRTPPKRGRVVASHAAPGEWKTVGLRYPRQAVATLEFRLDRLTPRRLLRVFGTQADALSGDLLTGITSFFPEPETPPILPGQIKLPAGAGVEAEAASGNSADFTVSVRSNGSSADGVAEIRAVAEADIWKVDGDRLYFFNERRGLQVFDLQKPDSPALLGTLRMPAKGEDMYLLDAAHVVLLKKTWNWEWSGGLVMSGAPARGTVFALSASSAEIGAAQLTVAPQQSANGRREIVIADVADGKPRVVGRVEFEGTVRESRLVGKVLYLATDSYRPAIAGGQPQWGLEVTSFDLHDPANPVRRASLHLGGWANAVTANDRTLLIAKWGARGSGTDIDVLDISDPKGAMTRGGTVTVAGSVADKFKLREAGGVLTVVSQKWRARTQQEIDDLLNLPANVRRPDFISASSVGITAVNTFSLANPAAPAPLGTLDLAVDETLHATRFDGDRLYVITAQHRPWIHLTYIWDPLWIVDLADPAQPRVLGELEMPGYSTYIEPLGDRLVTIGLVDARPTVALFDISDAATPAQLSRIVLTAGEWTHSAAVWDEKAFSVLPEENLILMPLSGWNSWTPGIQGVQLLDLFRDRLVQRGLLAQPFAPRRATVHRGRIVAISPDTLLTIDATNRDRPRVTSDVEIAWNVERVFAIGSHLVQIGSAWSNGNYETTFTVTPADRPDETLGTLALSGTPLSEATLRDGVLFLVQMQLGESWWDAQTGIYRESALDRVTLSAVDVSRLPRIALLGSATAEVSHPDRGGYYGWGAPGRALWINETTLGFNIPGVGRSFVTPYWYDPAPYDTGNWVWVKNPDAPSVDEEAIRAGANADVIITQIYIGKVAGHYEYVKTGTIDPPGSWSPSPVYRTAQRVFAFDVSNPARPRFASHIEIGGDQPWEVASPVAADGAILASYQYLGRLLTAETFAAGDASDPQAFAAPEPARAHRHFLQTVDYADPRNPIFDSAHPNLPGTLTGTTRAGRILFTTGLRYDPVSGVPDSTSHVLHASALDGQVVHLLDQLPLANWQPPLLRGGTVFQFQAQPAQIWVPSNEPPPVVDPAVGISATITLSGQIPFIGNGQLSAIRRPVSWNPVGNYEPNPKKSTLTTWALGADGKFAQLGEAVLDHESTFHLVGNLGIAYARAIQPRLLDVADPAAIGILGFLNLDTTASLHYDFADGAVGRGLWIPTGPYGLEAVILAK